MTNSYTKKAKIKGVELRIRGIVQGVGFRPFIYNLARSLKISGTVKNTGAGVFIQATGTTSDVDQFIRSINSEAPPLAQILKVEEKPLPTSSQSFDSFSIIESEEGVSASTAIPPDIALCQDCLDEVLSPNDRRYGYPFTNCTNCGPRFTIIETIPYDRPATSMKVFPMCSDCEQEYNDPTNRRFHAQPNACPVCGPQLSLHNAAGELIHCTSPLEKAITVLQNGHIMAIRGLGGFHLAVNGYSKEAIELLRRRKHRPSKPLAIMVKDLAAAEELAYLSNEERRMLTSPQSPIVLLRKKEKPDLAENLCPGVSEIGIMLPYTPLHHLLFNTPGCPDALVMTSGNLSGRPICTSNEDGVAELGGIADFFLLHNREILTRVDDSVTREINGRVRLLRRARGFAPSPLLVDEHLPQTLGCGGGLKSTFCLARDDQAYLSQHIGDLYNLESYDFFVESVKHHQQVFEIEPEIAVCDLHPDYMSTRYAEEQGVPIYQAQHHHAHAVAVMAEHGLSGKALGVILDGTGFGPDGTIWGGEFLLCDLSSYERVGHFQHLHLVGGDKAVEEPWRMGLAALHKTFDGEIPGEKHLPSLLRSVDEKQRQIVSEMIKGGFNAPLTSSCGRLFDAVAALAGIRLKCDFEGQAAMELEARARDLLQQDWQRQLDRMMARDELSFFLNSEGKWEIISTKLITMVMDKTAKGFTVSQVALDFHLELICAITQLTQKLSRLNETDSVILSGGCMQNRLLMEGLFYTLEKEGLKVYTGEKVPVNDGGISFGQIIIGGLQHVSSNSHAGNQSIG